MVKQIIIIQGNKRADGMNDVRSLDLGEFQLHLVNSVRNLGVYFNSKLNFKEHIDMVVKNCNFHIPNLYAVKQFLDSQCLLALVNSLILSRVDYCNALWVGLSNYLLKKVQSVLNRAARLIFGLPPRTPTTPFLIELHWLPIKARIEFKLCLMTFKILTFGEPKYLAELINHLTVHSGMTLCSSDDPSRLEEPRAVRECPFAARSFSYTAPRLYNQLPVSIKQLTSVESFKKQLKTFLFRKTYDLVDGTVMEDYRV